MVKRLIASILSMALVAGVITPQLVYGGVNTIPIQLVKQGNEKDYVENAGYEPTVSNKGISATNIKKELGSHYENKTYIKTELEGKHLKSLSWLDPEMGLVKYELDGASIPDGINTYYKIDEMIPQAKYNFEGGKATIHLSNNNEERLEIVDETGMNILEKDIFIPTDDTMADYYFYVATQEGMKDTDIQVTNGSKVITPIENVSTATTKVLKYKLTVEKGQEYIISVSGTPITREAKIVFDVEYYNNTKIPVWYKASYIANEWDIYKYQSDKPYCIVLEDGQNEPNTFILELNGYAKDKFWRTVSNWLIGKMTIAGETVQLPAPMIVERGELNYLQKLVGVLESEEKNPTVYTKFTSGVLAGSTVGVRLVATDYKKIDSQQGGTALRYKVTIENPPKEDLPIQFDLEPSTQGHIVQAQTKGIETVEIQCWEGSIYSAAPHNLKDTSKVAWTKWSKMERAYAKSILGNGKGYDPDHDRRGNEHSATINQSTTSDQKFKLRYKVKDGYVSPKVVYAHQEVDNNGYPVFTNTEVKSTEREGYHELDPLVVPRYGYNPNMIGIGTISSMLFQVELHGVPVYIGEGQGALLSKLNVETKTVVQIPEEFPKKEGSYFSAYLLEKYKDGVKLEDGTKQYFYPGEMLKLSDIGQSAINGEVQYDEVRLVPQFGIDPDENDYVKIQKICVGTEGKETIIEQNIIAVVSGSYIRLNNIETSIKIEDSKFRLEEKDSDFKRIQSTDVKTGDTNSNQIFDAQFRGEKILKVVYKELPKQSVTIVESGTDNNLDGKTVPAGTLVTVNVVLRKGDTSPNTIRVAVPGTGEEIVLVKVSENPEEETVLYAKENVPVTKADAGYVTIVDTTGIEDVDKITKPHLTIVANKHVNSVLTVSPTAITMSGSSIGVLELKDNFGNPINGKIPTFQINDQLFTGEVRELGDGKYEFTYWPDYPGVKYIDAIVDGEKVADAKLVVESLNGTITITKDGKEVDKAEVGDTIEIKVTIENQGETPPNIIYVVVPSVDEKVALERQEDGSYKGSVVTKKPALGEVSIVEEEYQNITPKPLMIIGKQEDEKEETVVPSIPPIPDIPSIPPVENKPVLDKPLVDKPETNKPPVDKSEVNKSEVDKSVEEKPVANKPSVDNTNTSVENPDSSLEEKSRDYYNKKLNIGGTVFLTGKGYERLKLLPEGTKFGKLRNINYELKGKQIGRIEVIYPNGKKEDLAIEVMVLGSKQPFIYEQQKNHVKGMNSFVPITGDEVFKLYSNIAIISGVILIFMRWKRKNTSNYKK